MSDLPLKGDPGATAPTTSALQRGGSAVAFALATIALFVVYGNARESADDPIDRQIVVDSAEVAAWAGENQALAAAAPDGDLAAAWIRDEALYREALGLGLHLSDTIVRRRIIQKMLFSLVEGRPLPRPTDADLVAWIADNPERYQEPARASLEHVYVGPEAEVGERDIERVRDALARGEDWRTLGRDFIRGREFSMRSRRQMASVFGDRFGGEVIGLDLNVWSGPFNSAFGPHFVRVTERQEPRLGLLSEVRRDAERDYLDNLRRTIATTAISELMARYDVTIEEAHENSEGYDLDIPPLPRL